MNITNRLFTYPVLSDEKDDYKESFFSVDYEQSMQGVNSLTYKYDMVNGMLPKAVEVFTGCKVGDVIEMRGKEWRIEDVIF